MIAMNAINAKAAAAANHDNTLPVTASTGTIDCDLLLKRTKCTLCERCTPIHILFSGMTRDLVGALSSEPTRTVRCVLDAGDDKKRLYFFLARVAKTVRRIRIKENGIAFGDARWRIYPDRHFKFPRHDDKPFLRTQSVRCDGLAVMRRNGHIIDFYVLRIADGKKRAADEGPGARC
jgi:hypothetical protein